MPHLRNTKIDPRTSNGHQEILCISKIDALLKVRDFDERSSSGANLLAAWIERLRLLRVLF